MKINSLYDEFKTLCFNVRNSTNVKGKEMLKELMELSYEYTGIRLEWNFISIEDKHNRDRQRTLVHNRVLAKIREFILFELDEQNVSEDYVKKFFELDRKDLGDFANQIVADFAMDMK